MEGRRQPRSGAMRPGQDIVALGFAGLYGTARLAEEMETQLAARYSKSFISKMKTVRERYAAETVLRALPVTDLPVTDLQEAEEGGIFAALWKLAADHGAGFHIWAREIPLLQETVELCEFFNLNPYRLHSTGCVAAVADNGFDVVRQAMELGLEAAVIGKVDAGIKRLIDSGSSVSFMERPRKDEMDFDRAVWKHTDE